MRVRQSSQKMDSRQSEIFVQRHTQQSIGIEKVRLIDTLF